MHPGWGDLPQVRDGTPTHRSLETASYFHRYLVNNSPAICSRVTVGRPLHFTFDGARSAQRRLYLAEFTGGALIPTKPKLSDADGKLHLVMGGTYLGESAMGCKWPSIELLAGASSTLDLHFHLYGTLLGGTGAFIPSRFVDYLEAGVFVLVPWHFPQFKKFARAHGVGAEGHPASVLTKPFWDQLQERVPGGGADFESSRDAFSMARHAPRLAAFYR